MKILYCITRSDTIGGAHVHVADMANWMRSLGHEAVVIVGGRGRYCEMLEKLQVPYVVSRHLCRPIHLFRDASAVLELRHLFARAGADVISLHSAKAGLLGRVAARGLSVPIVYTAHGWSFTEGIPKLNARVYLALERAVAGMAERIITVSDFDRQLALAQRVGTPEQLVAIRNAMPDSDERAHVGSQSGVVRMTMVARLDSQKDHHTLLSALAGLLDRQWVLDLVGDGPLEGEIRAAVKAAGLRDRVNFLGLRNDVATLLARSQLFVLSTNWEGFPRSILEAMRAGLPVVATAVGGVPEAVRNNETGLLVPRRDVQPLRDSIAKLLDDPQLRIRFGAQARRDYEDLYRFERMARSTLRIYSDAIQVKQASQS